MTRFRIAALAFALLFAHSAVSRAAAQDARQPRRDRLAVLGESERVSQEVGKRTAPVAESTVRVTTEDESARETRQRFIRLLQQYPPSLGEVFRVDPSLMTNDAYLTPYPGIRSFLAQHPEVARNPGYFVGDFRFNSWDSDPRRPVIIMMENVLAGSALLAGFITLTLTIAWLLKSLIEYRRWLRLSKIQTEAHAKLFDRLTSNEDLLAYIQSPVGRRFLESAPIPVEAGTRPIGAPIGRILWSAQAGMVVAFGGLGLLYASTRMAAGAPGVSELSLPLFVMGIVALGLGLGFVVSAVMAYGISRRLGLFEAPVIAPHA